MDTQIAMATAESTVLMTHAYLARAPRQATKATFAPVRMAIPALDAANARKATLRPIAQTANRAINAHRRAPNHALLSWSNRCFSAHSTHSRLNPMPSSSSVAMAVSALVPTSTDAEHKPSALRGMVPELKNVLMRKSTLPTISEKARPSKHTSLRAR